jgi:hypothetical protein
MLEHRRKLAERLSRLVCLMVGTDKPGECVAAAAALQRALASAGMNHHDLADAVEAGIAKRELAAPAKPARAHMARDAPGASFALAQAAAQGAGLPHQHRTAKPQDDHTETAQVALRHLPSRRCQRLT